MPSQQRQYMLQPSYELIEVHCLSLSSLLLSLSFLMMPIAFDELHYSMYCNHDEDYRHHRMNILGLVFDETTLSNKTTTMTTCRRFVANQTVYLFSAVLDESAFVNCDHR
jgi:hypothetical protein